MRQLSGIDAAFLAVETPRWPMHVACVTIFDPSRVEGGYSVDRLKQTLRERMHRLPPFRRRAVEAPLGLARPYWVEDPEFDLDFHVRRIALPSPGGPRELSELACDLYRQLLDRRRPLWEWWVVEGLRDGRVASFWKIHHACIDGMTGAGMQEVMFDSEPDPPPLEEPPGYRWRPESIPSDTRMLLRSLPWFAQTPFRLAREVAELVPTVRDLITGGHTESIPTNVPRTSFNHAVSQQRRFAFTSVSLSDVKRVKNAFGTKVNDVVLSICGGALRRYLLERGELPAEPLIASVPVNVRGDSSPGDGNQISGLMTGLATELADPVERLRKIYANTQASKVMHEALGAQTIMNLADTPPPMLLSMALGFYARTGLVNRHRPLFNVIISNVPGPRQPLYSLGAEVEAFYPMGIGFDGVGLFIGLMSYRDQIDFGLLACRELVPDPWFISEGIELELQDLVKAADAQVEAAPGDDAP
ncbi:MAG: wax ester/triacylglycerol synthase family O-acyltransferase [Proteobacteria bacterium]|nr:wax ester/triacylglycerol synthase family O-acyltransferase [Pseudomonadota bacterium]